MRKEMFDMNGAFALSDDDAVAKHLFLDNGTQRYYVKVSKQGNDAGLFVNPGSMWFIGLNERKFDKRTRAKSVYEFKQVKKEVFDLYIRFLQTKNQGFLRWAERECVNG